MKVVSLYKFEMESSLGIHEADDQMQSKMDVVLSLETCVAQEAGNKLLQFSVEKVSFVPG